MRPSLSATTVQPVLPPEQPGEDPSVAASRRAPCRGALDGHLLRDRVHLARRERNQVEALAAGQRAVGPAASGFTEASARVVPGGSCLEPGEADT